MKGGMTKPSEDALNKLQQDVMKQYIFDNSEYRKEAPSVEEECTMRTKK